MLWPEQPPASPECTLRTLVSRLRKALGEGIIVGRSELTLELPADATVDIESAAEGIKRAERALEQSSWEEARSAAQDALSVTESGFLPHVEAHWVEDESRRLEELGLRALECMAACGLGVGGAQLSATERAARRLIEVAPYRETGYRYLIEALAARTRGATRIRHTLPSRSVVGAGEANMPCGTRLIRHTLAATATMDRSDSLCRGRARTQAGPSADALHNGKVIERTPVGGQTCSTAEPEAPSVWRIVHAERLVFATPSLRGRLSAQVRRICLAERGLFATLLRRRPRWIEVTLSVVVVRARKPVVHRNRVDRGAGPNAAQLKPSR